MTDDTERSGALLTQLMTHSVDDLDVPVDRLRRAAVTDGRRLRLRRRALGAVGSVAAATAVVLALSPGSGGRATDSPGVATQPSAPAYSETANPSAPSTTLTVHADPGPGFWDMPAAEMLTRLEPLLPDGVTVVDAQLTLTDTAPGESHQAKGWLRVTLSRAGVTGHGDLELMLWSPGQDESVARCPGNLQGGPGVTCTPLPDHQGRTVATTVDALRTNEATLRAEKGYVYVATANSMDDKWGAGSTTSTTEPLLTVDEVATIATSHTWVDWTPGT
jgi:hypothetical protein